MNQSRYELCARCDHFVERVYDDCGWGGAESYYVHLDDGEQEYDHDGDPSGTIRMLPDWKAARPDLFFTHVDGKIGPNSAHHRTLVLP